MSVCIPCEYKKFIEGRKLELLQKKAKQRAIENKGYMVIYYDEEDKKYSITNLERAEKESLVQIEVYSPY